MRTHCGPVPELAYTHLATAAFHVLECGGPELLTNLFGAVLLCAGVKEADGGLFLKGNLLVEVDATAPLGALLHLDARGAQLALLLQLRQAPCLLQLLLPCLPLCLLAPAVPFLLQHSSQELWDISETTLDLLFA